MFSRTHIILLAGREGEARHAGPAVSDPLIFLSLNVTPDSSRPRSPLFPGGASAVSWRRKHLFAQLKDFPVLSRHRTGVYCVCERWANPTPCPARPSFQSNAKQLRWKWERVQNRLSVSVRFPGTSIGERRVLEGCRLVPGTVGD